MPTKSTSIVSRLRVAGCVFAEDEAAILMAAASTPAALESMIRRRVAGLPLEHVVGWAEFCGVRIAVDEGVFVPRVRSELLVREAVRLLSVLDRTRIVLDMCCGSGALGVAVAAMLDDVELHSADVDPVAVRCARHNVEPLGGEVYESDVYKAMPRELRRRVDVIVANVPYVPTAEIALLPSDFRDHEPAIALDGGDDGLDVARRVVAEAPAWLAPGGHVLFEVSDRQAETAAQALTDAGLTSRVATSPDSAATVMVGSVLAGPTVLL
jgi:release factor glutamine methyltransferase